MSSDDNSDNDQTTIASRDTITFGAALGSIVVAVDIDHKASQYALKWAIDRLLCRETSPHRSITLLNVRHIISFNRSHPEYCSNNGMVTNFVEREPDDHEMETLRHFRGFCARRQIEFEIVVVEDDDVAQALVDYAIRHRVENLLLGAPSRNGLSRLFKHGSGITSTVVKWIPNFCNVYFISKFGKLNNVRNAHNPVPSIPPLHRNQTNHELSVPVSTRDRRRGSIMSDGSVFDFSPEDEWDVDYRRRSLDDFRFLEECTGTSLFLTHKLESMEEGIRRLKLEKKQTKTILS